MVGPARMGHREPQNWMHRGATTAGMYGCSCGDSGGGGSLGDLRWLPLLLPIGVPQLLAQLPGSSR